MPSFTCSDTEIESDSGISRCKKQKNKPLMEKKRRARINRSLSQLKQILIQDEHKNSSQHSKWEKADILEMTVEYLQALRSSMKPLTPGSPGPSKESLGTPQRPSGPSGPSTPTLPLVPYPVLQQYMAYHQLAQLSMYSSMFQGISGSSITGSFGMEPKGRSQSSDK